MLVTECHRADAARDTAHKSASGMARLKCWSGFGRDSFVRLRRWRSTGGRLLFRPDFHLNQKVYGKLDDQLLMPPKKKKKCGRERQNKKKEG